MLLGSSQPERLGPVPESQISIPSIELVMSEPYNPYEPPDEHNRTAPPTQGWTGQGQQYAPCLEDVDQYQGDADPTCGHASDPRYHGLKYPGVGGRTYGDYVEGSRNIQGGYQQPTGENFGFVDQQTMYSPAPSMPMQGQSFPPRYDQRQHGPLPSRGHDEDIDLHDDLEARQRQWYQQNSQPWSTWQASGNHDSRLRVNTNVRQVPGHVEVPTPGVSTATGETSAWSWEIARMPSQSSFSCNTQDVMVGSGMTLRQQDCTPLSPMNRATSVHGESEAGRRLAADLFDLRLS